MCIRDRPVVETREYLVICLHPLARRCSAKVLSLRVFVRFYATHFAGCLLYTSDAADERSSVDLGGRRIIKKKNNVDNVAVSMIKKNKIKEKNNN